MPFSNENLDDYLRQRNLSQVTCDYIRRAAEAPSRDVGTTTYRSVVCEYPSQKMGTSIVTESRTGEFAYAVVLEYDTDVIAYFEQPPPVDVVRTNQKGHRGTRLYHPDFLVLRRSGPVVIQIKPHDALLRKTMECASDWSHDDGRFRDGPADSAFGAIGLVHEVIDSGELPKIRVANLKLLLQARASACRYDASLRSEILRALDRHAVLRVSELAQQLEITDLTPIVLLIDDGQIHTLVDTMLLSQPDSCWVSRSLSALTALVSSRAPVGTAPVARIAPLLQAQRGIDNLARVEAGETGRTIRRHKKAIAEAAKEGRSALEAVTPKSYLSGNRTRKRPSNVLAVAESFVCSVWATANRPTLATCVRSYKAHAAEQHPGQAPVSRGTLTAIIARHTQEGARERGGLRAGNAAESPTDVGDRALLATLPFELASCDHYLCDVHCVVLVSGEIAYTSQPWLTILRDCATGVLLAYWLSFRAPSRIACSMVLRSCLRRHGRLPEGIVVDRGAEFRSVYFASLLAHCAIALVLRPSSHPRYGSEAERFFGEYKALWLNLRPGNTAIHQESRSVSSSHAAPARAELQLCDLYREIEQFSDWRNNIVPNSGARAPRLIFEEGLRRFPNSGRQIPFDETFRIASSVDGTKITPDPARGLLIGEPKKWYWSPALGRLETRKQLEVRRDSEDDTVVYARVGDQWHPCFSFGHAAAQAKDPIVALCDSVISLTGSEARKKAKDDADIALVHQARLADERLKAKQAPPSAPEPGGDTDTDPFASLRGAALTPAAATPWEAP